MPRKDSLDFHRVRAGYQTQSLSLMKRNCVFYCPTNHISPIIPPLFPPFVVNFYPIRGVCEIAGCSLENRGCSRDLRYLTVVRSCRR